MQHAPRLVKQCMVSKFPQVQLKHTDVILKSDTGDIVHILGGLLVSMVYEDCVRKLSLPVIKGNCPSLLGLDWLKEIKLNWTNVFVSQIHLDSMLKRYSRPNVFVPDNKGIQGLWAHT